MKSQLMALVLILGAGVIVCEQPKAPKGHKWQKMDALSDEFNAWDDTKWEHSLWNYEAPVKMTKKNVGVDEGKLWIKATLGEDEKRWFETGRVISKATIGYPMYTECRMKASYI